MIKASVASGWKEPFEQDRVEGMCPGDSYSGQSDSWLGSYSWDCHEDAHSRSPGASTVIDQTCPDVSGWHLSPHLHSGHTSQTGTKPGKVTKAASSWVTCNSSDSRLWFLDFPTALLSLSQAAEWSRRLWPNLFFFFLILPHLGFGLYVNLTILVSPGFLLTFTSTCLNWILGVVVMPWTPQTLGWDTWKNLFWRLKGLIRE